MEWNNINELCDVVRKTSLDIHQYHRSGHLEKIYENALVHGLLINFGTPKLFIKKYIQNRNPALSRNEVKKLILSLCVSCASLWPFLRQS